jgi:hypothetical protein
VHGAGRHKTAAVTEAARGSYGPDGPDGQSTGAESQVCWAQRGGLALR